jgi:hypothetical protein
MLSGIASYDANTGGTVIGNVNRLYSATTAPGMNELVASYRLVSWGLKISNLQPELAATGRLYIAILPCGKSMPSIANLSTKTLTNPMYTITGMNDSSCFSSDILQFPVNVPLVAQDLLHGDVEISGSYTDPNFFRFRAVESGIYNTTDPYFQNDDVLMKPILASPTTPGSYLSSTYTMKDITDVEGGCAIILYGVGFPSTDNGLNIEFIYHVEATPAIRAAQNTLVPSEGYTSHIGSSNAVVTGMQTTAGHNGFSWVQKGAEFLQNAIQSDAVRTMGKTALRAAAAMMRQRFSGNRLALR